ncbi:MAG: hypothetical protein AAGC93_15430 [Cyanobacteria bacterium P01_F01_bin.53]
MLTFEVLTCEVCISELHTSEFGPGGISVAFSMEFELFGLVEPTEFEGRMGKCPKEAYVTDYCFQHASCMPLAGVGVAELRRYPNHFRNKTQQFLFDVTLLMQSSHGAKDKLNRKRT